MKLDECKVGMAVVNTPGHGTPIEQGVITAISGWYVFVMYAGDQTAKATDPDYLTVPEPPTTWSNQHDYVLSIELARLHGFYPLLMAAMRNADSINLARLRNQFPELWEELQARYNAPGGYLEGEDQ